MPISSGEIRLSVIVCTLNPADSIRETFLSLRHQSLDTANYEVLVVDSGSESNKADFLQCECRGYDFRYERLDVPGLSLARNHGVLRSRGDLLYFVDDDAVAPAHLLELTVAEFDASPDRYVVGGPVHGLWSDNPPHWLTSRYWRMLSLISYGDRSRALKYPEIVIGCNMAFRKSLFLDGLSFAQSLGRKGVSLIGSEERLLQKQIIDRGNEVYYSSRMYVFHRVPAARMTFDYLGARAEGSDISHQAIGEGVGGLPYLLKSFSTLLLALAIYPLHILKFGFQSASVKIYMIFTVFAAGVRRWYGDRKS